MWAPTAGPARARSSKGLRSYPAGRWSTGGRASPRWTWRLSSPGRRRWPWWTSWRTPTCRVRPARSAGRTSSGCSTPGSTISTVNVQHLESVNDVVEQITGVPQRETVPDEVVRRADEIELVDMSPEALRRRMAHGNVYPPEKVDAALGNYFRVGNLTALRELALLWLADKVDDQLDRYRADHDISGTWEARERVVVALSGGPEGDTLIRRASRIADRSKGTDLVAVHVTRSDGLTGADPANLARQRALVESLGGNYRQVVGDDIPQALLDFAGGVNATQLVLGASRRGRFAQILSRGVGVSTTALSGSIDVHMVTHEGARGGRRPERLQALTRRPRMAGFLLAAP